MADGLSDADDAFLALPLAARWNFLNFQSPAYSAVMMEFITPASYGRTSVNVSMVVKDGEVISAGTSSSIEHSASHEDPDNQWPEPEAITCKWNNQTKDGSPVVGLLSGDLGEKADRIDVLAHVPGFVKSILGGVVGTKPFIYQVSGLALEMKVVSLNSTH